MRIKLSLCLCLCFLIAHPLYAEATQKKIAVREEGETVLTAIAGKAKIRVVFKTRKVQKGINEKWDKKLSFVPSTCTFASWCSLVDKIDITVNDKEVFVPHSLISDLAILNNVELKIDGDKMYLLIESGDASESCFIRIDFNREHVQRMSIFADDTMKADRLLSETVYHLVVD